VKNDQGWTPEPVINKRSIRNECKSKEPKETIKQPRHPEKRKGGGPDSGLPHAYHKNLENGKNNHEKKKRASCKGGSEKNGGARSGKEDPVTSAEG